MTLPDAFYARGSFAEISIPDYQVVDKDLICGRFSG